MICKWLGDEPSLVIIDTEEGWFRTRHDIPRGEKDANRRHLIISAAAGFAAKQVVFGSYEEAESAEDVQHITALGGTVPDAVASVVELLVPLKYVVMSVAEAIDAAADQGRKQISAEELQIHYELGLNIACHAAINQRPGDSAQATSSALVIRAVSF